MTRSGRRGGPIRRVVAVGDLGLAEGRHRGQGRDGRPENGSATAAPEPSPRRIPRSTMGSRPRCARAIVWAGSVERWPACHHPPAPGAIRSATNAAPGHDDAVEQQGGAPDGCLRAESGHGGEIWPAADTQQGKRIGGAPRARYSASRTAAVLRAQPRRRHGTPADHRDRLRPVSAEISAAAGVVFPMPMSPAMRRSAPASISSSAMRKPAVTAAIVSASVMASSTAMLPLPRRTLCAPICSETGWSQSTETSTTRTVAPALPASTLIAAPLSGCWRPSAPSPRAG